MGQVDIRRALEIGVGIAEKRENRQFVLRGTDPSIERHAVELFGTPAEPNFVPANVRYVEPRKVLMEWLGEPSPYDSELIRALIMRGLLSPVHRLILDRMSLMRRPRIDGHTSWTLGPREGLSRTYRWGKQRGTYLIEVDFVDVDRLLAIGATGLGKTVNQFAVRGDYSEAGPMRAPDEAWAKALDRIAKQQHLPKLPAGADRLRIASGPEETLKGVNKEGTYGQWNR